jgi:antitoxin (DNA-binding transcriptional repressor) of toxin-antitoxin stability system
MKTVSVTDFKAQFSGLLHEVRNGERIAIHSGPRKETVAVLIPPEEESKAPKRVLGALRGKASFKLDSKFKMTEEEFLNG